MSVFTDEDLEELKSVSNVLRGFNHHVSYEKLKALLARLEAAEKLLAGIGRYAKEFEPEYTTWLKASGRRV